MFWHPVYNVLEAERTLLLVNPQHIKMKQVKESNFRDVKRFAAGLERDQEEILSGHTLVYSNRQVEGQINQLKLIKRQGYGRAGFSILRLRVLHAP